MKITLKILILIVVLQNGCLMSNKDDRFVRKHPESKRYIDFLRNYKDQLLSKEEQGLKFGWTLKVYCDNTEREDGFTAKAYIYQNKMRLDAIFTDNRKWTRIYDGKQYFEFVNGKKSTEFLERWGDLPPERPSICPILSKINNFHDFRIDSLKREAMLEVMINKELITIVFPVDELEKFYTLYYNFETQIVYKKEYGLDFTKIDVFILPGISITEIPFSNWCDGGKRFVKKYNFDLDFNWRPDKNTYMIKEQMDFIENFK